MITPIFSTRKKILQLLKYTGVSTVFAASVVAFLPNENDINSYGLVRLGRTAHTAFKIGTIYKTMYGERSKLTEEEYEKFSSTCHKKSAEELLKLCFLNKGVYIKVGQHLATLDYLIPNEYIDTMKVLHNSGPTTNIDDVYKVIREDLQKDPLDIFLSIDPEPTGTASLAQVHRATLPDGSVVALKVQHSYVKKHTLVDMKTMEYLVNLVSFIFPNFRFQWFVDEMKQNVPLELNFVNEGENAEKISKIFQSTPWLQIPKVRWDLTSPRILTMDYIEGGQINDLEYMKKHKIDPFEVSDKLGQLYSEMIFIHGFVHSDPHPGNIFIRKDAKTGCKIILLDHGLYATLSKEFKTDYANFWLCILDRDKEGMKLHSKNLGIEGEGMYGLLACMVTGRSWNVIVNGLENKEPSLEEKQRVISSLPEVLPHICSILQRVNRQMYLIFKANGLVHGIEHTLRTRSRRNTFKTMSECCVRSVYSKKLNNTKSALDKVKVTVAQYWVLFKLNVYYTFSNITQVLKIIGI